jgi:23S rRNA maturation mini-RNase III
MNTYRIYFELYGKKMMTSITAKTQADAISQLRNKIEIHKVENVTKRAGNPWSGTPFEDIFGKGFNS